MITFLKEVFAQVRLKNEQHRDRLEREQIAKVFNDRYTYREKYDDAPAWMCPDCNNINYLSATKDFTGYQFPGCCSYPEGHRLFYDIRLQ
jgi:ssDNA-binding Zn-finger/Zn-ribbon topoisomerase 1